MNTAEYALRPKTNLSQAVHRIHESTLTTLTTGKTTPSKNHSPEYYSKLSNQPPTATYGFRKYDGPKINIPQNQSPAQTQPNTKDEEAVEDNLSMDEDT
jgi:hypothetical protein